MCGIAGRVSGERVERGLIERMCAALRHRGPDEEGVWVDDGVGLGMRRLSIIDVAGGHQPMFDADEELVVVFNGEIYDAPAQRDALQREGHIFRTLSDTELILQLYRRHGDDCVSHLRGMFAFALWDRPRRRLLMAVDRVGKKPLYYRADGSTLTFGSELKALLADPSIPREVDLSALSNYLGLQYVPAPQSILRGINKLPPAHRAVWVDDCLTVDRYWQLDYTPKLDLDDAGVDAAVRRELMEATRVRLDSERPVGAFLSGGIDSSLVVACMSELSPGHVRTFTIGFDEELFDERSHARAVAQRFGTEHHELVVRPSALESLPELVYHYDEPFADSSAIPSMALAEVTRREVVVALNGDGADESFGGYVRYALDASSRRLEPIAPMLRSGARLAAHAPSRWVRHQAGRATRWLADGTSDGDERYARMMSHFDVDAKRCIMTPDLLEASGPARSSYALITEAMSSGGARAPLDRLLATDVATYLPGDLLVKMDRASMAASLEARSPFLDHHLMELAARLDVRHKRRGRRGKIALRRIAQGWLPDQVIDRPKRGFGVPMASWLRSDLRPLARELLTDATAQRRGWFRPDAVATLLREHDGGRDHSTRIWNLLVLEAWSRRWLDE